MQRRYSLLSLILLAALVSEGDAQAATQPGVPKPLQGIGIDQRLDETIPLDLPFRDERGDTVPIGNYFGEKPVILAFVYYECPMLCTLVLNGLVRALRALPFDVGDEFEVVTISFDPSETPALAAAKKAAYIETYGRKGAAKGWHFLTGEADAIERLTKAAGFRYRYDPKTKQFAHAAGIIVLTPAGRISKYFYGVEYSPRDLRLSLVEAASDRIGSAVDRVLLWCFHYDPEEGRYSLTILRSLRLFGSATVLLLTILIAGMVFHDRKKKPAPR